MSASNSPTRRGSHDLRARRAEAALWREANAGVFDGDVLGLGDF